jgi:ribosome-binding protein aMBF1 (putative translation factor)
MRDVEDLKKELMKNPNFRREYEALEEEFALADAFIRARVEAHMTQAEVAKKMGTTQSVIARLESGTFPPSYKTIQRFAKATGHKPVLSFVLQD